MADFSSMAQTFEVANIDEPVLLIFDIHSRHITLETYKYYRKIMTQFDRHFPAIPHAKDYFDLLFQNTSKIRVSAELSAQDFFY